MRHSSMCTNCPDHPASKVNGRELYRPMALWEECVQRIMY
jgi:hypothetical protein